VLGTVLIGVVLATGACRDAFEPTRPNAGPQSPNLQVSAQVTAGDPLIAYANQIPGFAGSSSTRAASLRCT
jgi:hypothetical protein